MWLLRHLFHLDLLQVFLWWTMAPDPIQWCYFLSLASFLISLHGLTSLPFCTTMSVTSFLCPRFLWASTQSSTNLCWICMFSPLVTRWKQYGQSCPCFTVMSGGQSSILRTLTCPTQTLTSFFALEGSSLPVQGTLLQPLHGYTSFHKAEESCFSSFPW